jgi:hypothetical protein
MAKGKSTRKYNLQNLETKDKFERQFLFFSSLATDTRILSLVIRNGKKRLNGKNDTILHDRPDNFDKKMGNLRKWLPIKFVNKAEKGPQA